MHLYVHASTVLQELAIDLQIYFGKEKVVILKSRQGFEVHILTLGAVVQKLLVPDKKGVFSDVVLGFDTLGPYKVAYFWTPPHPLHPFPGLLPVPKNQHPLPEAKEDRSWQLGSC